MIMLRSRDWETKSDSEAMIASVVMSDSRNTLRMGQNHEVQVLESLFDCGRVSESPRALQRRSQGTILPGFDCGCPSARACSRSQATTNDLITYDGFESTPGALLLLEQAYCTTLYICNGHFVRAVTSPLEHLALSITTRCKAWSLPSLQCIASLTCIPCTLAPSISRVALSTAFSVDTDH